MTNILELFDYRRRVQSLYHEVRDLSKHDFLAAHKRWRSVRDDLFATHPQSALSEEQKSSFNGLRYFDYNPAYRFTVPIQLDSSPEQNRQGAINDPLAYYRLGVVELPVGTLEVYWFDSYGGGVFIPFRDGTSGDLTYGGGRYLLDTIKGADLGSTPEGHLILDFNFAYHPSCHYNPIWSCPLAPPSNHLTERIEAGEMAFL